MVSLSVLLVLFLPLPFSVKYIGLNPNNYTSTTATLVVGFLAYAQVLRLINVPLEIIIKVSPSILRHPLRMRDTS
jgi:hypothetical protein